MIRSISTKRIILSLFATPITNVGWKTIDSLSLFNFDQPRMNQSNFGYLFQWNHFRHFNNMQTVQKFNFSSSNKGNNGNKQK